METRKIAMACFVGGAICVIVALIFTPMFWWLGLIAGFVSGYLAYEFQEVLKSIPKAFTVTYKWAIECWKNADKKVIESSRKPHPFLYPSVAISSLLFLCRGWLFLSDLTIDSSISSPFFYLALIEAFCVYVGISSMILCVPIVFLAFLGVRFGEKSYWVPLIMTEDKHKEETIKALQARGLVEQPLTYRNTLRWVIKGIFIIIQFFVWTLWKYLAIGVYKSIQFLLLDFLWEVFKLIHSQKRLLCAIDGTLGGALSYVIFSSFVSTRIEQIVMVIFGGILGAGIGVINWELVSKRLLKLPVK